MSSAFATHSQFSQGPVTLYPVTSQGGGQNRPLILMANQLPSCEVNYWHLLASVPAPADGHTPGTQSSERWGAPRGYTANTLTLEPSPLCCPTPGWESDPNFTLSRNLAC